MKINKNYRPPNRQIKYEDEPSLIEKKEDTLESIHLRKLKEINEKYLSLLEDKITDINFLPKKNFLLKKRELILDDEKTLCNEAYEVAKELMSLWTKNEENILRNRPELQESINKTQSLLSCVVDFINKEIKQVEELIKELKNY